LGAAAGKTVADALQRMITLDAIQWPAMIITISSAWLVASKSKRRRTVGFLTFLLSNVLWLIWGWHDRAFALMILQACLAVMNTRGLLNNNNSDQ
jgi:hypothetical protein